MKKSFPAAALAILFLFVAFADAFALSMSPAGAGKETEEMASAYACAIDNGRSEWADASFALAQVQDNGRSEWADASFARAKVTGQGQGMVNAGRTLLYTGAGAALTGLVIFANGALTWENDPECPQMPMYPILSGVAVCTGAALALIATPLLISGNARMEQSGAQLVLYNDMTGGAWSAETTLGIPNFLSFDLARTYRYGNNLMLGAGLGYKAYLTQGLTRDGATAAAPVYASATYSFGKQQVTPYISVRGGYNLQQSHYSSGNAPESGIYTALEFGTRRRDVNPSVGSSWWLGTKVEFLGQELSFISLKIGRTF